MLLLFYQKRFVDGSAIRVLIIKGVNNENDPFAH